MSKEWRFVIQSPVFSDHHIRLPDKVLDIIAVDHPATSGLSLYWNYEQNAHFVVLSQRPLKDENYVGIGRYQINKPASSEENWIIQVPEDVGPIILSHFLEGRSAFYLAFDEMIKASNSTVYVMSQSQLSELLPEESYSESSDPENLQSAALNTPGFIPAELSHQMVETIETLEPGIIAIHGGIVVTELYHMLKAHIGKDSEPLTVEKLYSETDMEEMALPNQARKYLEEACSTFSSGNLHSSVDMAFKTVEECLADWQETISEKTSDDPWEAFLRSMKESNASSGYEAVQLLQRKRTELEKRQGAPSRHEAAVVLGLIPDATKEIFKSYG